MAPKPPAPPSDGGSDMSEEEVSSVLLALPDGPIASDAPDGRSFTTSFIGGYPTFPAVAGPSRAPDSVNCGSCNDPMPLLAQVYCPLENGENDRTLYVWACARERCRRREGSIRAYRASARNEEYVADVAAKKAEAERRAAEERERARVNPFTMKGAPSSGGLFGNTQPLFGAAPSNPFGSAAPEPSAAAPTSTVVATPAAEPAQLASLTLSEPVTLAAPLPAYQPSQYLATIDEYLPLSDDELPAGAEIVDEVNETAEQKAEWRDEGWERLLPKGVDDVFERFVRRLESAEDGSTQVLRYDFGSVPLPYSSSSPLFKQLFPKAPTRNPSSEDDEPNLSDYYNPSCVPACPRCKGKRVFELQVVPQLINVLRPNTLSTTGTAPDKEAANSKVSEQERRAELERLVKGEDAPAGKGDAPGEMEWGTIMVFGCENDCLGVGEEWVGVEWEAVMQGV